MPPLRSGILAEVPSTLIKTFSIVFFLNLYYAFMTDEKSYDGRKNNEQRANTNEQRAKSNKQRVESNEQRAESNEQQAKSNEQQAESNEQQAKCNEQRAKSNEQRAMRKKFNHTACISLMIV